MKAWDAAIALTAALIDEHSAACSNDPMKAVAMLDLIAEARKIQNKLDTIRTIEKEQTERKHNETR